MAPAASRALTRQAYHALRRERHSIHCELNKWGGSMSLYLKRTHYDRLREINSLTQPVARNVVDQACEWKRLQRRHIVIDGIQRAKREAAIALEAAKLQRTGDKLTDALAYIGVTFVGRSASVALAEAREAARRARA